MPSPLAELLSSLSAALSELGVRWYLFGAQAAIVHGAVRLTADVDVTVDLDERPVRELFATMAALGFDLRVEDAEAFAERTRVVPVVHRSTQMPVDIVLAGPGLEEQFLAKAQPTEVAGVAVPVARAEDIVVMKVLAGRPKDDDDVVAILASRGRSFDFDDVERTLRALEQALDRSDLVAKLKALRSSRRPATRR